MWKNFGFKISLFFYCAISLSCNHSGPLTHEQAHESARPLKVAIIGDSGYNANFRKTLELVASQGADLVVHVGDLAYDEENPQAPQQWDQVITEVLGEKFPYLITAGNHDVRRWNQKNPFGYKALFEKRVQKISELNCFGELGVNSFCLYRGLFFLLSSVGTMGEKHTEFIEQTFNALHGSTLRFCAWHKNQKDMEVGEKEDEVGWDAYRLCQKNGAVILTGHSHTYSRTLTLTDLGNRANGHGATGSFDSMEVGKGKTFVVVSGLGGNGMRKYLCDDHLGETWWASIFTHNYYLNNGVVESKNCEKNPDGTYKETVPFYNYGALFLSFGGQNPENVANGEFITVDHMTIDSFKVYFER